MRRRPCLARTSVRGRQRCSDGILCQTGVAVEICWQSNNRLRRGRPAIITGVIRPGVAPTANNVTHNLNDSRKLTLNKVDLTCHRQISRYEYIRPRFRSRVLAKHTSYGRRFDLSRALLESSHWHLQCAAKLAYAFR
jgi:hypothetical protein